MIILNNIDLVQSDGWKFGGRIITGKTSASPSSQNKKFDVFSLKCVGLFFM